MLEIKNLYLSYTKEYFTLNNINLTVADGEHIVLLGEKESGKSSLVRMIAGLEKATKGSIEFNGQLVQPSLFKQDVKLGYLSSTGAFFNRKNVLKNLQYVLKIRGLKKDEMNSRINACVLLNKLENILYLPVKNLSKFDQYRVAIARLSLRPLDVILVDDIFEQVSEEEAEKLVELLDDLQKQNPEATVIVAVDNEEIANLLKGKIVRLKYGSVV